MQSRKLLIVGLSGVTLCLCILCCASSAVSGPHFLILPFSGLPRSYYLWPDMPDMASSVIPQPQAAVVSVDVESVQVENGYSLLTQVLDDDPVYALDVIYNVHYADGTTLRVHWSSWRYGFVFGPFVFVRGNGPPSDLETLD